MYLYGASGHAKVIIDILVNCDLKIKCLFDDNPNIKELSGFPVLRYENQKLNAPIIISIGNNSIRKKVANHLNLDFGRAIHTSSIIASSVSVGLGTVIMHGATVQVDTLIGDHVIINTLASIDHDCKIGNFAHISPGAVLTGNVQVGEGTHIGAGAVVIPGVKIGKWCTIGAGAVVVKDIPDNVKVVGNPARVIKNN